MSVSVSSRRNTTPNSPCATFLNINKVKFGLGIIAFLSSPRHKNHTLPTLPSYYPNIISFKMIDTLNSTHYLPVLPENSCIYPEGMRDKSTHELKKKKGVMPVGLRFQVKTMKKKVLM